MGRGTFGVSDQLKSIIKHRILAAGLKGELCKKKTGAPILTTHMSYYVFLHKKLPLGGVMIASALKFLVALIFLIAINFLMC